MAPRRARQSSHEHVGFRPKVCRVPHDQEDDLGTQGLDHPVDQSGRVVNEGGYADAHRSGNRRDDRVVRGTPDDATGSASHARNNC